MRKFVSSSLLALALTGLLTAPALAQQGPATVPDLSQQDPGFNGGGDQYCAPVAVSNSLWWLSKNGFPQLAAANQVQMAKTLARQMSTGGTGTGPIEVIAGLKAYLGEAGLTGSIVHRGWRQTTPSTIDENFLLNALGSSSVAWVNLGWYRPEGAIYHRGGGHWVTLVGVKRTPAGLTLLVHDPSPRTGGAKKTETVLLEKLTSGTLRGAQRGLPRSAAGLYKASSGLTLKSSYNTALIDSVVTLKL